LFSLIFPLFLPGGKFNWGRVLEGVAQFANYRNQSLLVGQPKNSIKSTKLINYKLKRISGKVGSFSILSLHSQLLWVFLRFYFPSLVSSA